MVVIVLSELVNDLILWWGLVLVRVSLICVIVGWLRLVVCNVNYNWLLLGFSMIVCVWLNVMLIVCVSIVMNSVS